MTLVTNEVHLIEGLIKSILLFAADRRISTSYGAYDSSRKELFRIDYLEAGVSYFGLANVFPGGKRLYMSEWLQDFIRHQSDSQDLQGFANRLAESLNCVVPPSVLTTKASGFHLAGYTQDGYPDFIYFSNIGDTRDFRYTDLKPRYDAPTSHFLARDALEMGWDGRDPNSANSGRRIYRNGDIRGHVAAWERLDQILMTMFQFDDFKRPSSVKEYEAFVKAKFEMIAYVYKIFARKKIIARPIDVFSYHRL